MRVKQAAEYLGVTPQTVRNWCNDGKLPFSYSAAQQRIFTTHDLDNFKRQQLGLPPLNNDTTTFFYGRTSNKQDISLQNQLNKLENTYGKADFTYTDTASGLSENRRGLNALLKKAEKIQGKKILYITNKDRLTRFGFTYIEKLLKQMDCAIEVLDSDDTKEPLEVLLQDFMSLLASFSGRFYRMRGWEQQKKFLRDVQEQVDKNAQRTL